MKADASIADVLPLIEKPAYGSSNSSGAPIRPDLFPPESQRLSAILVDFEQKIVKVLDQLLLPHEIVYVDINNADDAVRAIKTMQVRGAPLIATVAVLGLYKDSIKNGGKHFTLEYCAQAMDRLRKSRPTAVNLTNVLDGLVRIIHQNPGKALQEILRTYAESNLHMEAEENAELCQDAVDRICRNLKPDEQVTVMTICNTGTLATTNWGTALGIVYALHAVGRLKHVVCLETRPYNQGSRLTATELHHLGCPFTLVTDSMAAAAIDHFNVDIIIVGADRVTANGDVANKIGTRNLATVALEMDIPFCVAFPNATYDPSTPDGSQIVIEQRAGDEFRYFTGTLICEKDTPVWNPSFDVTDQRMIAGYFTDRTCTFSTEPDRVVSFKKQGNGRVARFLANDN